MLLHLEKLVFYLPSRLLAAKSFCLTIACASVLRLGALACWRGARGRVPYMDRCGTQTTEGSNLTQW